MGCLVSKEHDVQSSKRKNPITPIIIQNASRKFGPEDTPPGYSESLSPSFRAAFLRVINEANHYSGKDRPNGTSDCAFYPLRHRAFELWLDTNPHLQDTIRQSLLFAAQQIILLAQAHDCNMNVFFTGCINEDNVQLSARTKVRAKALTRLWETKNWDDGEEMVNCISREHPALGLDHFIKQINHQESDSRKHYQLLNRTRDIRARDWFGWPSQEIKDIKQLESLYDTSARAERQQPQFPNQAAFTIKRAIELQRCQRKDEQELRLATKPTTVLILQGSPLENSETDILKCELDQVTGGGAEFAIQTLLFQESSDKKTGMNHLKLDGYVRGDKDIYDLVVLDPVKLLKRGLSAIAWMKIFGSHDREIDKLKIRDGGLYGEQELSSLEMPSVEETREAIRLRSTRG